MSTINPPEPIRRRWRTHLRPVAILPFVLACGESAPPTEPPVEAPPADMNVYMAALPTWDAFSPEIEDFDGAIGDPAQSEEEVDGTAYRCTTTPYSLTRTPDKVVTLNPDVEILWAGSLLQGKGYVGGIGSLAELPIRQRGSITLSIDLLTGNNTRTVENPSLASVTAAVGDLIQAASNAGHRAGSKIAYTQENYHALAEASVRAGLSAKYQGATIKASLEAEASVEKSTVMAVYTQQMFTVSMELPQTPGAVFSDALTQEILDQQVALGRIGPDNLPVYVSSVVYGRTVVFSMTAKGTHAEIKAALSIAVGENSGELSTEQKALLETSEIKLVTIGGDAANAASVIRSGDFSSYFDEDAALTTARPISYTIRNVADNTIARVSETTNYNLRECAAADLPVTGATYRIRMVEFQYLERGSAICALHLGAGILLGAWRFTLTGENPQSGQVETRVLTERNGAGPTLSVGQKHPFPNNGLDVNLRFNDPEGVSIGGEIRGTGIPPALLIWKWNPPINYKGTMSDGVYGTSRWGLTVGGVNCGRGAVRFRIDRLGDLNS